MKLSAFLMLVGLIATPPLMEEYNHPFLVEIHMGSINPSDSIPKADVDTGFTPGISVTGYFVDNRSGIYTGFDIDVIDADSADLPVVEAGLLFRYWQGWP